MGRTGNEATTSHRVGRATSCIVYYSTQARFCTHKHLVGSGRGPRLVVCEAREAVVQAGGEGLPTAAAPVPPVVPAGLSIVVVTEELPGGKTGH